jgi:hypothetical protein
MLVKDINKLPATFYFKSKINPFNILYKAEKGRGFYRVNCAEDESGNWIYTKEDMWERLRNDEYVVVPEPDYIKC